MAGRKFISKHLTFESDSLGGQPIAMLCGLHGIMIFNICRYKHLANAHGRYQGGPDLSSHAVQHQSSLIAQSDIETNGMPQFIPEEFAHVHFSAIVSRQNRKFDAIYLDDIGAGDISLPAAGPAEVASEAVFKSAAAKGQ